jgi:HSP20 family protein
LSTFEPSESAATWIPNIDVFTRGNELVVRADLPGVDPENVRLEIAQGHLIIEGERRHEEEKGHRGAYRFERSYGGFRRAVTLPEGIDLDRVKADLKSGVLEVRIELTERQQRRLIPIQREREEGASSTAEPPPQEDGPSTVH